MWRERLLHTCWTASRGLFGNTGQGFWNRRMSGEGSIFHRYTWKSPVSARTCCTGCSPHWYPPPFSPLPPFPPLHLLPPCWSWSCCPSWTRRSHSSQTWKRKFKLVKKCWTFNCNLSEKGKNLARKRRILPQNTVFWVRLSLRRRSLQILSKLFFVKDVKKTVSLHVDTCTMQWKGKLNQGLPLVRRFWTIPHSFPGWAGRTCQKGGWLVFQKNTRPSWQPGIFSSQILLFTHFIGQHLNCKLCDKFPAGWNIWFLGGSRQQHICEEFPEYLGIEHDQKHFLF